MTGHISSIACRVSSSDIREGYFCGHCCASIFICRSQSVSSQVAGSITSSPINQSMQIGSAVTFAGRRSRRFGISSRRFKCVRRCKWLRIELSCALRWRTVDCCSLRSCKTSSMAHLLIDSVLLVRRRQLCTLIIHIRYNAIVYPNTRG